MLIHCENSNCKHCFEDSCMKNMNKEMISIDNTGRCVDFEKGVNEIYSEIDNSKRCVLTKEEVLKMLPNKDYIHTFRDSAISLIGADWSKKEILKTIENYEFELTGQQATSMGHGIAFQDNNGWVFVETK
ncbi:hypothetical protein CF088_20420 [Clostridium botulinum]|uniref:hypothetical protein n=2 Tax=Clostridium botulinum TaxID=1491 RepID=UPI000773DB30|nr:hypothetical protein [Clostridium botulinum]APH21419.1 hypothetical protein NPD1_2866 [Clostridium botulinum]APQ68628.1 hypothetical protein RSJ8_992 [Clostridium botulinum]MBN3407554.1 hypothetical protein [Clostridium botulinum]QDY17030.1 hypothetical protein CGQ27_07970 [Clostridium botulinum]